MQKNIMQWYKKILYRGVRKYYVMVHILFLKILFKTIYIELMFDYNGNILKIY